MMDELNCRWKAVVTYKTISGLMTDTFVFEEIFELHNLIEEGPNFYCIESIVITHHAGRVELMALEEAATE